MGNYDNNVAHPPIDTTLPLEILMVIAEYLLNQDARPFAYASRTCLNAYNNSNHRHTAAIENKPGFNLSTEGSLSKNFTTLKRMVNPNPRHYNGFFYQFLQMSKPVVPAALKQHFPAALDDSYVVYLNRNKETKIFTKYDLKNPIEHLALFLDENGLFKIELAESADKNSNFYKPQLTLFTNVAVSTPSALTHST